MKPLITALLLCFTVPATLERVIDGDTFIASLQLFHDEYRHARVRLPAINAPELPTPEGLAAKAFATTWLQAAPFQVRTCGYDKYGRVLGNAVRPTDDLVSALVKAGHVTKP
jgi:endonuclease YncB( thermonuclease family)